MTFAAATLVVMLVLTIGVAFVFFTVFTPSQVSKETLQRCEIACMVMTFVAIAIVILNLHL
jgi:NADH:ubiquinone oxidoreductase subunit 6 (subunit J)